MGNTPIGELPVSLQALVTARAEGLAQGREEGREETERPCRALGDKAEDEAFLTRLFRVLTLEPLCESDLTVFETRAETDLQRATVRQLSVVLVRAREEGGSEEIRDLEDELRSAKDGESEESERADNAEAELKQVRKQLTAVKAERDSALSQLEKRGSE